MIADVCRCLLMIADVCRCWMLLYYLHLELRSVTFPASLQTLALGNVNSLQQLDAPLQLQSLSCNGLLVSCASLARDEKYTRAARAGGKACKQCHCLNCTAQCLEKGIR